MINKQLCEMEFQIKVYENILKCDIAETFRKHYQEELEKLRGEYEGMQEDIREAEKSESNVE